MKVMVIVKASPSSEAGQMPSQELLAAMGAFNEELVNAGIMLEGAGLKPSSAGARVRFSGKSRMVIDGPFTETKELIAGYWIWKVQSLQEAIEWVKKCPNPMLEDSEIEIRPFFEVEDFGEALTPELKDQEATILARSLGLEAPRFEQSSELTIAGLHRNYSLETRSEIPQQWQQFLNRVTGIPGITYPPTYGVCWNSQPDYSFDYLTGIEVTGESETPADFITLNLHARRYAVFSHQGHVSQIPQTLTTIWSKWAPECSLGIAKAPCFERYTAEFDPSTGKGGIELWIPLA